MTVALTVLTVLCSGCRRVDNGSVANQTKVFVNGNWVGIVPDAEHIAQVIRDKRRQNLIDFEVSVYRDIPQQELHVFADGGRVCRPLYVVETQVRRAAVAVWQ